MGIINGNITGISTVNHTGILSNATHNITTNTLNGASVSYSMYSTDDKHKYELHTVEDLFAICRMPAVIFATHTNTKIALYNLIYKVNKSISNIGINKLKGTTSFHIVSLKLNMCNYAVIEDTSLYLRFTTLRDRPIFPVIETWMRDEYKVGLPEGSLADLVYDGIEMEVVLRKSIDANEVNIYLCAQTFNIKHILDLVDVRESSHRSLLSYIRRIVEITMTPNEDYLYAMIKEPERISTDDKISIDAEFARIRWPHHITPKPYVYVTLNESGKV